jgi:hypothetical protein
LLSGSIDRSAWVVVLDWSASPLRMVFIMLYRELSSLNVDVRSQYVSYAVRSGTLTERSSYDSVVLEPSPMHPKRHSRDSSVYQAGDSLF